MNKINPPPNLKNQSTTGATELQVPVYCGIAQFIVLSYWQNCFKTLMLLLMVSFQFSTFAQVNPNPVSFTWENYVGCIKGEQKVRSYEDAIAAGVCHTTCQGSTVIYKLNSSSTLSNTVWTVLGGTILTQSNTSCTVKWSSSLLSGAIGASTFTPTAPIIFNPICVDITIAPTAVIGRDGINTMGGTIVVCRNTAVNFNNLSTTIGGTAIDASLWTFGNLGISTAANPTFIFNVAGTYIVSLTSTNKCFCSNQTSVTVIVTEQRTIPITCATMVCEGQVANYSVPANTRCNSFNWSVTGGTIISAQPYTNTIEVKWDVPNSNPDLEGFGYVSFNPGQCNEECTQISTVKIPIIKTRGTIIGNISICGSQQEIYRLPQWPTTDFQWTIVNHNGGNASLVNTDQRNEVIVNSGNIPGSFTLSAVYQNTLLKCGGSANINVTVRVPATIEGPNLVCLNSTGNPPTYTIFNNYTATWQWKKLPNGSNTTVPNVSSISPAFPSTGDYSISITNNIFCNTETFLVKVVDPPMPTLAGLTTSQVICPNTPMTFTFNNTVANSILHWSVVGGKITGSATGNSVEVIFDYPVPQGYAIKISRELNGCRSAELSIPLTLPVISQAIMGFNATAPPVINTCGSTSQTYTMPFSTADSYNWTITPSTVGSLSTANGSNTVTVLWNQFVTPTQATLSVAIRNCGIITTKSINVNVGAPVIAITPIVGAICSQNSFPFSLTSTPPLTQGTVTWDFGDGTTATGMTGNHTYDVTTTSATSYTVTATIANPNGCNATIIASQVVNVAIAPVASITPAGTRVKCVLSDLPLNERTLVATLQSGYGGATIDPKWYRDNVLIPGANTYTYIVTDFGSYHVVVSNGTCTSKSNEVKFLEDCTQPTLCNIVPNPNLTLAVNGSCGSYNATASYTGSPAIIWSTDGIISSTNTSATYNFPVAGYYGITYQAIYMVNGLPCRANKGVAVTVPYIADIKYKVNCPNPSSGQYSVQLLDSSTFLPFVTNLTYKFFVNNIEVPYTTGLVTQRTTNLNPNANYNLRVDIQQNGLPLCSKTIPLYLPPLPNTAFTVTPGPYCQDAPISFTVTNPQAGNVYDWSFGDNMFNRVQNPSISYASGGSKFVTLTVTNSVGCMATSQALLVPVTSTNFAGTVAPEINTACAGGTAVLTFSPAENTTMPPTFQWMQGNQPVSGATTNPVTVTQPGRYWLKAGSTNGCFKDIYSTVAVSILPPIVPTISGQNAVCVDAILQLVTTYTAENATYKWTCQGPGQTADVLSTAQVLNMQLDNPGTYIYTLEVKVPVTGGGFCTGTTSHTVTVYDIPDEPTVTAAIITCQPYRIKLTATSTTPGQFMWSNGDTGTQINPTTNEIIVNEGGPYEVVFTNASGCSAAAQIAVPRSLERYMWIVPTGCFNYCDLKDDNRTLLGPGNVEFAGWGWLINTVQQNSGIEAVEPFNVDSSGVHQLQLNNGWCTFRSGRLEVNELDCRECENFLSAALNNIEGFTTPFFFYTIDLMITNPTSSPLTVTPTAFVNNGIFNPTTVVAQPGTHSYSFQYIPLGSFVAGTQIISLEFIIQGKTCMIAIPIEFPDVTGRKNGAADESVFTIAPNPAADYTKVTYEFPQASARSTLELFDMMGRKLDSHQCDALSGTWNIDTSSLNPGQYLIVLKEADGTIQQKRLVKKP